VVAAVEVLQARLVAMDPARASTVLLRMVVAVAVPGNLQGEVVPRVVVAVKTVPLHPVPQLRGTGAEMVCRPRLVLQLAAVAVQAVQDCKVSLNAAHKFLGEVTAVLVLPTQSQVRRRFTAVAVAAARTITPLQLFNLAVAETAVAETAEMETV
jgi:hypothetical protein